MVASIKNVISTCIARDIRTWLYVSRNVLRHIAADNYYVIVPEIDVDLFSLVTPKEFTIVGESSLIDVRRVTSKAPAPHQGRARWYYQQLLKLAAIQAFSGSDDDINLIWDADTLPVRDLTFVLDGRLTYYQSSEHHRPYFAAIDRLLGLQKNVNFSFIAQCFPIYAGWLGEMLALIEHRCGTNWIDAIATPEILSQPAGFSEYETMGTFIVDRHKDEIAIRNGQSWERLGAYKYPGVKAVAESETLGREHAFITFEYWSPAAQARLARLRS